MAKRELAKCEIQCPTDRAHPALRFFGWTLGGIAAAAAGGVLFWKWSQISSSGVPLTFAMKRTFSKDFFEGHLGLTRAYEDRQGG